MDPRKAGCFLALLLMACAPRAVAQGTYTQIDVPGALDTTATGIDAAGEVIGYYYANGVISGFLLSGGTYTTINYPGSQDEYLYGINAAGTKIVGYTDFPKLVGFVYDISTQPSPR